MMSKFIITYAVLFFIVPMTMISIMYILIGIKLWKSQDKLAKACEAENDLLKKKSFKKRISSIFSRTTTSKRKDKMNQQENSLTYDENEQADDDNDNDNDNDENKNSRKQQYTQVVNTNSTMSDRAPKELEQISERAKQSRRDVVKMLCKLKIQFTFNSF